MSIKDILLRRTNIKKKLAVKNNRLLVVVFLKPTNRKTKNVQNNLCFYPLRTKKLLQVITPKSPNRWYLKPDVLHKAGVVIFTIREHSIIKTLALGPISIYYIWNLYIIEFEIKNDYNAYSNIQLMAKVVYFKIPLKI